MSFNFNIKSVQSLDDIKETERFLLRQDLYRFGYPGYEDWVARTVLEIESKYKSAYLCYESGVLAADLIHQPHKELPYLREIKNMRVVPGWQFRGIARFLFRQAEVDEVQGVHGLICDVRATETETIKFLLNLGYFRLMDLPIYDRHHDDVVLIKPLGRPFEPGYLDRIRDYLG